LRDLIRVIHLLGDEKERRQGQGLVADLRMLARDHSGHHDIVMFLTKCLFNAATNAGADTGRADRLLDDLRRLSLDHSGNADIALPLAKGLVNAVDDAGADTGRADRLLDDLRRLNLDHSGNADIALHLAMGLFNALTHGHGDDDALVGELSVLAAAYPGVEMIQKAFALAPEAIAARDANRGGIGR
jgi:hypothetical protein